MAMHDGWGHGPASWPSHSAGGRPHDATTVSTLPTNCAGPSLRASRLTSGLLAATAVLVRVLVVALAVGMVAAKAADAGSPSCGCAGEGEGPVIIVGAGISGLVAAQTLRRAGCTTLLLEAGAGVGGRTRSLREGPFAGRDRGAHWVHGGKDNLPVTRLLEYFNITQRWVGGDPGFEGARSRHRVYDRGAQLPQSAVDEAFDLFGRIEGLIDERLIRQLISNRSGDVSMEVVWEKVLEDRNVTGDAARLLRWQIQVRTEQSSGADLGSLGARTWELAKYNTFAKGHNRSGDAVVVGGFAQLAESLAQGLDIRLNTLVRLVVHSDEGVMVSTGNETFNGRAAIITASLGAMQAGHPNFEPAPPQAFAAASQRLRLGALAKVFISFREDRSPLVDDDSYLLSRVLLPGEEGIIYYCIREAEEGQSSRVLECMAGGKNAMQLENLASGPSHKLRERVLGELRLLFPTLQDSDIEDVEVVSWASDPLFRGAWVYGPVGSSSEDFEILAEPRGRLRFAGEATCRLIYGSVSGAIVSGARAAAALIEELSSPPGCAAAAAAAAAGSTTSEPGADEAWPLFDPTLLSICDVLLPESRAGDSGGGSCPISAGGGSGGDSISHGSCVGSGGSEGASLGKGLQICQDSWYWLNEIAPSQFQLWHQQPRAARQAWQRLGWSALVWSGKGPLPPSTRLAWEDLSVRWQSAAQSLGYTEKLWNDYKGDQGSIVVCRTRPRNFQVWDKLSPAVRANWRLLGFGRGIWDEMGEVPRSREWAELTEFERRIAVRLGYRRDFW